MLTASDSRPDHAAPPTNNNNHNPTNSSSYQIKTSINASSAANSDNDTLVTDHNNENINVSQSPSSRNSSVSFHNTLSSVSTLDPAATKAKSNPFLSDKKIKKPSNPFGNTKENAASTIHTTSTATSNPFASSNAHSKPFRRSAAAASTTSATSTTSPAFGNISNPFAVGVSAATSAKRPYPFARDTPSVATSDGVANPEPAQKNKASFAPAQETSSSAASTSKVCSTFLSEETSKVSCPEDSGSSASVPKNPFLAKDIPEKEATNSASSTTAASNSFATADSCAVDSNKVATVSSSSSSIPLNPFLKAASVTKLDKGATDSLSSIPSNPFERTPNGLTLTSSNSKEGLSNENGNNATVPSNSFAKAPKRVKSPVNSPKFYPNDDESATVTSKTTNTLPNRANGIKRKAQSPVVCSNRIVTVGSTLGSTVVPPNLFNVPDSSVINVSSSNAVDAKPTKKGLNPGAAVWKPNPSAAEFVPGQPPVMENKKNDNEKLTQKVGPSNSPYLPGYAPPLYTPSALPIVNPPRNVTVPFDPRIPNTFWISPPPPSSSSPLVGNPMVPNPSWNPFSGVGNVFNHPPILPTPAPTSRSPRPAPPSADLPQYPSPSGFIPTNPPAVRTPSKAPIGTSVKNNSPKASLSLDLTKPPRSTTNKALPITDALPRSSAKKIADGPATPGREFDLDTNEKATNPFMTAKNIIESPPTNVATSPGIHNTNIFVTASEMLSSTNPFAAAKQGAPETKADVSTSPKVNAPGNPFVKASELTSANLKLHDNGTDAEENNACNFNNSEVMRDSRGTRAFDLSFGQASPGAPPQNSPYLKSAIDNSSPLQAHPHAKTQRQFQTQSQMKTEGSTASATTSPSMAASATTRNKNSSSSERSPSLASSGKASTSSKKVQNNPFARSNPSNKRSAPTNNNTADGEAVIRNSVTHNRTVTASTKGAAAGTLTKKNSNPFAAPHSSRKKSKNFNNASTIPNNSNGAKTRPAEGNGIKKTNRALNIVHPFEPVHEKNGANGNGTMGAAVKSHSAISTTAQNGSVLGSTKKKTPDGVSSSSNRVPLPKQGQNGTSGAKDESVSSKKAESVSPSAAARAPKKLYILNPNAESFQNWTLPGENTALPDSPKPADIRRVEPEVLLPVAKPPVSRPYVKPPSSALAIVKPPSSAEPAKGASSSKAGGAAASASASDINAVKKSELKSELIPTYSVAVDNGNNNKKAGGAASSAVVDTGSVIVNGVEKRVIVAPHTPGVAAVTEVEERKNTPAPRTVVQNSGPVTRIAEEKTKSAVTAAAAIVQKPKHSTPAVVPKAKPPAPAITPKKPALSIDTTPKPTSNASATNSIAPKSNGLAVRRPTKLWIFCNGQEADIRKVLLNLEIPGNQGLETCFNMVNNTEINRNALHCKIVAKAAVKAYALKMERFMNIEMDTESQKMDHKVLIVSTMNPIKAHYGEELGTVELVEAKNLNQYIASLYK